MHTLHSAQRAREPCSAALQQPAQAALPGGPAVPASGVFPALLMGSKGVHIYIYVSVYMNMYIYMYVDMSVYISA